MKQGDSEYKAAVRRWAQLYGQAQRTFAEDAELDALHRRLDEAERQSVIERVASDYADLRHIGDLSGVEL